MARLKIGWAGILFLTINTLFEVALARLINTTVYDTNLGHTTYEPKDNFCARWVNRVFWRTCEYWAQPWMPDLYFSHGKFFTMHRSLNHRLPSVTIEFEGSAVWLYGPPRAQLTAIPPNYKVCLYEDHRLASNEVCYRVDVASAYSAAEHYDEPVVIFAKGELRHQRHRVIVSVGDPIDHIKAHLGVQFSHVVYTTERPTPWPVEEDHWRFRQVIMHDTHPLLSYTPRGEVPVSECFLWWCWRTDDASGWTPRTYRDENEATVSWHELRSHTEWERNTWGIETTIKAGSVAVYGIPKAHIAGYNFLSQLCIHINSQPCQLVDIQHAYLNSEHHQESVLLWRHDALDPSQTTHIAIRLVKPATGETSVFPFKAIHYFEPQEYSSPGPSVGHLENVDVAHDNGEIKYHPGRRCVRHFAWWCTKWFDPWVWREEGPPESRLTYRSTVSAYRATEDPAITLDFRGSAVYVYGAPKSFIKSPLAMQHVCINDICHIVDMEQAYLNAPAGDGLRFIGQHISGGRRLLAEGEYDVEVLKNATVLSNVHPDYEPVLIWSMTGLDDQVTHNLRLALAALPSDGNAEMTITKVVYTKVSYGQGESRPDIPIPQPDSRYNGPPHPPYAREWVPRVPSPPSHAPSPPSHIPSPLPQAPNPARNSTWIVIFIPFPFVLIIPCLCARSSRRSGNRDSEYDPLIARWPTTSVPRPAPPTPRPAPLAPRLAPRPAQDLQPNPPIRHSSPSQSERNNLGPCPGPNLASPFPDSDSFFQPPSYTQPPSYSGYRVNIFDEVQTSISAASTVLPSYTQVLSESRTRQERALEYVIQQRTLRSQYQPAALRSHVETVRDTRTAASGHSSLTRAPNHSLAQGSTDASRQYSANYLEQTRGLGEWSRSGQLYAEILRGDPRQHAPAHTSFQNPTNSSQGHPRATSRGSMTPGLGSTVLVGYMQNGTVQRGPLNQGTPGLAGSSGSYARRLPANNLATEGISSSRGRGRGGRGRARTNNGIIGRDYSGRSDNNVQNLRHEQSRGTTGRSRGHGHGENGRGGRRQGLQNEN